MNITRRNFIVTAAGSAGAFGLVGFVTRPQDRSPGPAGDPDWPDLDQEWRSSICTGCTAACGITGRIVDGRLVKIKGNPVHPTTHGGLCPRGIVELQSIHDPDRPTLCGYRSSDLGLDTPLRTFEPAAAIGLLAVRMQSAIKARGSDGVAILDGTGGQSGVSLLLRSLARSLDLAPICARDPDVGLRLAALHSQGISTRPAYDIQRSQVILAFGSGFLEEDASPVLRTAQLAALRRTQEGRRPKLVVIEPRFSATAARADRWLPIRPGTYGSLALGIAYVVLKESRHSAPFTRGRSDGYEDSQDSKGSRVRGFRSLALEEGRPERVSRITGIPVKDILEVGKLFASSRAAVAVPTREVTWHGQGVRDAALIHSLNALIGNLDKPGGALTPLDVPLASDPDTPSTPPLVAGKTADEINAEAFLLDVRKGNRPAPDVLLLVNAEPQEWPGTRRAWADIRERVRFVASIVSRPGPSVGSADLVLPSASGIESWDLFATPSPLGAPVLGVSRPLVKPSGHIKPATEWILELAQRFGERSTKALPWKSAKEHVRYRLRGVYEAGRGMPFGSDLDEDHLKALERRGWWPQLHDDYDSFFDAVTSVGGWWDPLYAYGQIGRVVQTPTGKFRFPNEDQPAALRPVDAAAPADGEQRIALHAFPILALAGGAGSEIPWLQPSIDSYARIAWRPWVEINPVTAGELNIEDGQEVDVGNSRGSFRALVRTFEGAMPGLLNVPIVFSPQSVSRYSGTDVADFFSVIGRDRDPVSGLASLCSTPLWVRPA